MEIVFKVLEDMVGPALLAVFGACAKYLRDIAKDIHGLKTAMIITKDRLDTHKKKLSEHDLRIRDLENGSDRGYPS